MPNRGVRTIRDLIYYQYAKIMARRRYRWRWETDGLRYRPHHRIVNPPDKPAGFRIYGGLHIGLPYLTGFHRNNSEH